MWRWHWLKKGKKEGQEKEKRKRRKREKGNKKKKKRRHLLALARQRKQDHGDHQPPSPGNIPAGPFNPSPGPVDFFFFFLSTFLNLSTFSLWGHHHHPGPSTVFSCLGNYNSFWICPYSCGHLPTLHHIFHLFWRPSNLFTSQICSYQSSSLKYFCTFPRPTPQLGVQGPSLPGPSLALQPYFMFHSTLLFLL